MIGGLTYLAMILETPALAEEPPAATPAPAAAPAAADKK